MTERETNGRFAKGNQVAKGHNGAGGRPPRAREEEWLAVLNRIVTPERLEKVFAVGLSRAMAGDIAWAKFLFAYGIGLPIQRTEVSGPEGGPVAIDSGIDVNDITEAIRILGSGNGCSCG